MKPSSIHRCRYFLIIALACAYMACAVVIDPVHALPQAESNWSASSAMGVQKISDLPNDALKGHVFDNVDCSDISYRGHGSSQTQTDCFTSFNLGLVKEGGDKIIFNGTDEALPLAPYSSSQTLVPWPGTDEMISLAHVSTDGMRLGIYHSFLSVLDDNRFLGELISKKLTTPAALVKSPSGKAIDVNPQTLAFSRNGDWLVVETLNGSFIRINRFTGQVMAFAQSYSIINSDRLLPTHMSIDDDGRYVAMYNQYSEEFRVYDLSNCDDITQPRLDLPPQNCASFDYLPFIKSHLPGLGAIRHVRFLNNALIEFQLVTSANSRQIGVYELAPLDRIGPLSDYLALGDSYTSGEGAFDYLNGTDTPTNKCHLSIWSYPFLVAQSMGIQGHSVACSGAVIKDVGDTRGSYIGQAGAGQGSAALASYLPGYIEQHKFVAHYQPLVTSVSVGGNDIGFGSILKRCVTPQISNSSCYDTYEDRLEIKQLIDRTSQRLINLYAQLRREAPSTRLYVIGYPQIGDKNGSCALNVRLDKSELEFTEEIIDYFNGSIEQAAARAGAAYLDISRALYGHRLCEGPEVAVNGLTAGDDTGPIGHESYHPNALGHALIAQTIFDKISVFTAAIASQVDASNLLSAPRTGRPINNITPVNMTSEIAQTGESITLSVDGEEMGLMPGVTYEVRMDDRALTTLISSSNSQLRASVKLPTDLASGDHFIEIVGPDVSGGNAEISQFIYVTEAEDKGSGSVSSLSVRINSISVGK